MGPRTALLLALAAAALAAERSRSQHEYLFPADLGPAMIDVSRYPEAQRRDYDLFASVCSQCHTLARAINAPQTTRAQWEPYVRRMHGGARAERRTEFSRAEAFRILGFLEYDSRERKLKNRTAFEAQQRELQRLFEEVRRTRFGSPPRGP